MTAKIEPGTKYATAVAIPRHLYHVAMENAKLISQVTIDAYKFIHSRCHKDAQIVALVTNGLNTLAAEYERGEHTKASDFDFGAIAHQNEVALAKDGKAEISVGLPDALYEAAEQNQAMIQEVALKFAPLIKEACGGRGDVASVAATFIAQIAYYDESIGNEK